MFKITEQAAGLLQQHLETKRDNDQAVMRIIVMRIMMQDGHWSWAVDIPRPADQVYEYKGEPVVAVRQDVSELLENKTLDIRETEKGTIFVINSERPTKTL